MRGVMEHACDDFCTEPWGDLEQQHGVFNLYRYYNFIELAISKWPMISGMILSLYHFSVLDKTFVYEKFGCIRPMVQDE